jgi:sugar phosphate isomerase/epimerase
MTPSAPLTRRHFLARSALASAAALATAALRPALSAAAKKTPPIGIELYAVRGELQKDLPKTLQTVAKIGYEVVEFYSPYFAWTTAYAREVRAVMDGCGLRCFSTHNHIASFTPGQEAMGHAVELNLILGSRTLVMAAAPRGTNSADAWRRLSGDLAKASAALAPHGLAAGFHNHKSEWAKVDGDLRIMDIIAGNTPKEFVLQFDVGTCMEAGADPIAWINAHPGRIRSVHLKDWAPGTKEEEKGYRVLFGEGVTPWREVLAAAESVGGVEYYLMEQEGSRYPEFETAERCLVTWKKLRG